MVCGHLQVERPALSDMPANKDACRVGGEGGDGGGAGGGIKGGGGFQSPILVEKSQIIRLASQYTPCAGCSAAVKALLKRPIHELRLLNAVMTDDETNTALR